MQFKPHGYQKFAIEHIIKNPVAALFLDMGLGKTVTTLTATICALSNINYQFRKKPKGGR